MFCGGRRPSKHTQCWGWTGLCFSLRHKDVNLRSSSLPGPHQDPNAVTVKTTLLPNHHFTAKRIMTPCTWEKWRVEGSGDRYDNVLPNTEMQVGRLCLRTWMWRLGRSPAQPPAKSRATMGQSSLLGALSSTNPWGWCQHSCSGQPLPMFDCILNYIK